MTIFLKNYYLTHKTIKIYNAIDQFRQVVGKVFWKYTE